MMSQWGEGGEGLGISPYFLGMGTACRKCQGDCNLPIRSQILNLLRPYNSIYDALLQELVLVLCSTA